ncbi:MAG: hypothetical protein WD827_08440 [Solirubrobacterales bacterium]
MTYSTVEPRRRPDGFLLIAATVSITAVSLFFWALIVLGAALPWGWSSGWIYAGIALPGATLGAVASHATGRRAYFWIGIAITLVPVALGFALESAFNPSWNNEPSSHPIAD